jgi:hypothetical protein
MGERTLFVGNPQLPSRVIIDPHCIDQPVLAEFLLYWRNRRRADTVPKYVDFVPRDFARHLASVIVTDAAGEGFRYRVVGSRVTRYFLSDATGKTIREEFGGELGDFLTALNQQACSEGIPIRLTGPAALIDGILFPNYDTLYLPWATHDKADKVVSVFVFDPDSLAARDMGGLPASYPSLKVASADDLIR